MEARKEKPEIKEIYLLDKPYGVTSFAVVASLRRQLGVRKVGHAGTLDPLATGLMILGVGPGTKKLTELIKLDKEYLAEIRIGEARTTDDMEGEITEKVAVPKLEDGEIVKALTSLVGETELTVSAFSAIKKDGVTYYQRARRALAKGEMLSEAELPKRLMRVEEAELMRVEYHQTEALMVVTIRFRVGSGTYVRSLAKELGRRLGYPAVLQNLRRTQVGEFRIEEADKIAVRGERVIPRWLED